MMSNEHDPADMGGQRTMKGFRIGPNGSTGELQSSQELSIGLKDAFDDGDAPVMVAWESASFSELNWQIHHRSLSADGSPVDG